MGSLSSRMSIGHSLIALTSCSSSAELAPQYRRHHHELCHRFVSQIRSCRFCSSCDSLHIPHVFIERNSSSETPLWTLNCIGKGAIYRCKYPVQLLPPSLPASTAQRHLHHFSSEPHCIAVPPPLPFPQTLHDGIPITPPSSQAHCIMHTPHPPAACAIPQFPQMRIKFGQGRAHLKSFSCICSGNV
jgi:hypothetical protein